MTIQSIYLHRDDVETILKFIQSIDKQHVVEVKCDNSSGIGNVITATLHGVELNGHKVSVTKTIVDETSWWRMNERIRELAITDGIYDCICDPYDKLKNGDQYSSVMVDLERFAVKIVQECVDIAHRNGDDVGYLKNYFGI